MFIFSNSSLAASRLICVSLSFCNNRKRITTTVTKENIIPAGRAQKEERTMQCGSPHLITASANARFKHISLSPSQWELSVLHSITLTQRFLIIKASLLCSKSPTFYPFVLKFPFCFLSYRLCYCITGFKQT